MAEREGLRELTARRRQLIEALHAERCRLDGASTAGVRHSLEAVIAALRQSLERIEHAIARAITDAPTLAELERRLRTIFGVGPVVVATLIAKLPELGLLSGKQITARAGLAPRTRQSGKTRWRESIGHGRPGVRRALFNAAPGAIAHPSPFQDFHRRPVRQNGRPGKLAPVAMMRQISITTNPIARDRQPWRAAAPDSTTAPPAERVEGHPVSGAMSARSPSTQPP